MQQAKPFFENGFEAASVKMILDEANAITDIFYHFFPSKKKLFEHVVERFLQDYIQRVQVIFGNDSLSFDEQFQLFMGEIRNTEKTYYQILQGNHLHWTIQHALHNKTVEALSVSLAESVELQIKNDKKSNRC